MSKREIKRAINRLEKEYQKIENHTKENKEMIKNFKYSNGYEDKEKRVVRSITLSYRNDNFITEIQELAKKRQNMTKPTNLSTDMKNYINNLVPDLNTFLETYTNYWKGA